MIRNLFVFLAFLLLTACASTVPLQPGDPFYKTRLRVNEPYEVAPGLLTLGFHFPAIDYKALMKDTHGIYFASETPIMAKDIIIGTVYRTGGLYYQLPQGPVYYYLVDTRGFGGTHISNRPMLGLNYKILK